MPVVVSPDLRRRLPWKLPLAALLLFSIGAGASWLTSSAEVSDPQWTAASQAAVAWYQQHAEPGADQQDEIRVDRGVLLGDCAVLELNRTPRKHSPHRHRGQASVALVRDAGHWQVRRSSEPHAPFNATAAHQDRSTCLKIANGGQGHS